MSSGGGVTNRRKTFKEDDDKQQQKARKPASQGVYNLSTEEKAARLKEILERAAKRNEEDARLANEAQMA